MTWDQKSCRFVDLYVLLALGLLTLLLRLPSLEQPFDNDSGANAYHARLIVRGEPLYGTHHPGHHMPAVYYVYALAFQMLGDRTLSVKLLLIPWTAATAYVVYLLGRLIDGRQVGAPAALFYTLLTSHIYLYGSTAEAELFANLPRAGAVLLLLYLVSANAPPWTFVWVGVLGAVSFLFKAVYLSPMAMVGLVALLEWWTARGEGNAWRQLWQRLVWAGIGFAGGVLPVVAYFAGRGLLDRFLLVFTIGREYLGFIQANLTTPAPALVYQIVYLSRANAVVVILGLSNLVTTILPPFSEKRWDIAGWLLISACEVSIGTISAHYYLLLVPPLSLMAAQFVAAMTRRMIAPATKNNRVAAINPLIAILSTMGVHLWSSGHYYCSYARYKAGIGSYNEFLLQGWSEYKGNEFVRVQRLSEYLQEHTTPYDYIYYWSGAVQLYYQADRRCPIDMIWPVYAEATGSYKRIFVPRTKYVIVGESNLVPRPKWLYEELNKHYALETIVAGEEVYRRCE